VRKSRPHPSLKQNRTILSSTRSFLDLEKSKVNSRNIHFPSSLLGQGNNNCSCLYFVCFRMFSATDFMAAVSSKRSSPACRSTSSETLSSCLTMPKHVQPDSTPIPRITWFTPSKATAPNVDPRRLHLTEQLSHSLYQALIE
jgi:hypothetical protein